PWLLLPRSHAPPRSSPAAHPRTETPPASCESSGANRQTADRPSSQRGFQPRSAAPAARLNVERWTLNVGRYRLNVQRSTHNVQRPTGRQLLPLAPGRLPLSCSHDRTWKPHKAIRVQTVRPFDRVQRRVVAHELILAF